MLVKKTFRLVGNAPNVLHLNRNVLSAYLNEENSPRHIFVALELKKSSFKHFTRDAIFRLIYDTKKREIIKAISIDYPLPVSYNEPTKDLVINLKALNTTTIGQLHPNNLYSFASLVTGSYTVSDSYASVIVRYLLSFLVQVFGKEFGLVSIYSVRIPKLKFLLACYVLSSFFGYKSNLFRQAYRLAPYSYEEELEQLRKYDFTKIDDFVKATSDLKVMPGWSITKLTSKLYRYFGINILPAMEDASRFFSVILVSTIPGSTIAPKILKKYNEDAYFRIVDITRGIFK